MLCESFNSSFTKAPHKVEHYQMRDHSATAGLKGLFLCSMPFSS